MIGAHLTTYHHAMARADAALVEGATDLCDRWSTEATEVGRSIREEVDALLKPHGITLAQVERANLP